jgi:polyadenylate-binding protein
MQNKPVVKIPAQLHIGDLDLKVQETDVYSLLRQFGDISKIRLCRGQASAYAFVAFKDPETASRVRKELNGFNFNGRHIHVSKITTQRETVANVFVKNFSETITARDLEDLFGKFGVVLSSKVCYDDTGKPLGYGFVQFETSEYADIAIKNMNGKMWQGQELTVQTFIPLNMRIGSIPNSNLYVRGFPLSYSEGDLKTIFGSYGVVLSAAVMSDNGRAYGFVCFQSAEEARRACEHKNGVSEAGFTWFVTPHMSKIHRKKVLREQYLSQVEEWKKRNLYIKKLDKSIDEERLNDICKEYGPIKSLKICKMENIKYDGEGNCMKETISKEIAYVHFETEQSANLALVELQKKLIEGKKLYVAKWKPREALKKLISNFKSQKSIKYPPIQQRGFVPPRAMPRVPMMAGRGIVPFANFHQQLIPGRGRAPRVVAPQPPHMPIMEPKKAPVLRVDNIDQYTTRDLGEKLYPMVLKYTNTHVVGKITGMLLEMEKNEIVNLINDESRLQIRVKEAIEVLRRAWAHDPASLSTLPS